MGKENKRPDGAKWETSRHPPVQCGPRLFCIEQPPGRRPVGHNKMGGLSPSITASFSGKQETSSRPAEPNWWPLDDFISRHTPAVRTADAIENNTSSHFSTLRSLPICPLEKIEAGTQHPSVGRQVEKKGGGNICYCVSSPLSAGQEALSDTCRPPRRSKMSDLLPENLPTLKADLLGLRQKRQPMFSFQLDMTGKSSDSTQHKHRLRSSCNLQLCSSVPFLSYKMCMIDPFH